jgi:Lar family restriction alleviation protein
MNDLTPCPFCGGYAKLLHGKPEQQRAGLRIAFVQCRSCHAKTRTFSQSAYEAVKDLDKLATDAWNKRI